MSEFVSLVRFVHLTAAILLVGGIGFQCYVAAHACAKAGPDTKSIETWLWHSQQRDLRWCLILLFLSALASLWLQAAYLSDATITSTLAALVPLLTDTQSGQVWITRMGLLAVISALFLTENRDPANANSAVLRIVKFALSAALLAALALAGHAAAGDGAALLLQTSADALHLLAGAIWLGGLMPLALLLRECSHRNDAASLNFARAAVRRYSNLALGSVIVLIASGAYNAWNLIGGFAPLFGTTYGRLMLLKLALLLLLLGIGAVNLLKLKPAITMAGNPRAQQTAALRKLIRNVTLEALVGVVILLIVGHMGVTPPARHVQPDWPFSFRWDWSVLDKTAKALAEVQRGAIWAGLAALLILGALARRRRRILAGLIATGVFAYAGYLVHGAVMIDAYPDTYKRPAVAYQAISVANGKLLYEDSGCAACHGASGYGDGPAAESLNPKPPDLNGRHANAHSAGDLYWWLSHGVKPASAMPGFSASLNAEERWDLINYLRALASGDRGKKLAPVIEETPWLVAPDFTYGLTSGAAKTLKQHRGDKIVLLVLLDLHGTEERLQQIGAVLSQLQAAGVEVIVVPNLIDRQLVAAKLPGLIVSEGIREIAETYKLLARSFANESLLTNTPHVEFLIDRQGYIRARWLPSEGDAWKNLDTLMKQTELLRQEKPRAPAPDDHVH